MDCSNLLRDVICRARADGTPCDSAADVVIQRSLLLQPFAGMAVPNPILPLLGLVMPPTTTLGYCWSIASFGGLSSFSGLLVVATGLIDLGRLEMVVVRASLTV